MEKKSIDIYKEFAKQIEYPMVIFEAESGNVLEMNYDAEILLGSSVEEIRMEPERTLTVSNFWDILHGKKSIIWHRIKLIADGKEILVSGLINEVNIDGIVAYSLLFERRADLNIGSITLEHIVNHANIVAVNLCREGEDYKVDYVSQNINRYGYTRAQLYEGVLSTDDLVCPEDIGNVRGCLRDAISKGIEENVVECRLVSEQRDLIPVRLLVHYVYNDYGVISALEILALDLTEEMKKNKETGYLNKAISKMKSVVLVKSFKRGKRELCYISPNASMVGMNVEALTKGYKLTEDYIHPEDRDGVIDAIRQAVESGMTDYTQEYRMVRDDGRRIWVENEITVNRISDGEAEISFLLTDITERKELEKELAATMEPMDREYIGYEGETIDRDKADMAKQFQVMADVLGNNADYYSVLLDLDGNQMIHPVGPANDMGLFYDLFERPEFKQSFLNVSDRVQRECIPQSISFDMDSMKVYMVFAPVIVDTNVTAYWVMAGLGDDETKKISNIIEPQWQLVNSIAKCFYVDEMVEKEIYHRKITEMQLHKEQMERNIMESLIACISEFGVAGVGEICQKAGVYLDVTDIGIYRESRKFGGVESYYEWNRAGDDSAFFKSMIASAAEYESIKEHLAKDGTLVVDKYYKDSFLKGFVSRTGMGAIMLVELKIAGESKGYVMVADTDTNREFDKHVIRFTKILADLFGRMLAEDEKGLRLEVLHEGFLDAYNHIRDAVFVRDNCSGDIIFANKSAEKLFGYSLEGRQSKEIINDQLDQYRAMQGIRRRLIADKKITKWQSYMKELDQIMNIVEVHLDTINGADCSLIILKKNKNKDKKKD